MRRASSVLEFPLMGFLRTQLWDPMHNVSVRTFAEHMYCVYNAIWSPHSPTNFVSCSGDNTVKIWDTNSPGSVLTIPAHPNEVLAVDWNKYNEFTVASGSVDQTIKIWVTSNSF